MTTSFESTRVFIGSSTEGRRYADALFTELENASEPTIWDQDVFIPTASTLEGLEQIAKDFDFAVFILTPDDVRASRGKSAAVPRDNLIFELGLFIGAIGRGRVWFLAPDQQELALPSDLLGVTQLRYKERMDHNYRAAVRTPGTVIRDLMAKLGVRRHSPSGEVSFWHSIPDRHSQGVDVRKLIAGCSRRVVISGITLSYVAHYCKKEIREALLKNVKISCIIATDTNECVTMYSRFSPLLKENLPLAHKRYQSLIEEFRVLGLGEFSVFGARSLMTHSIGQYDDSIYVSEFCMDTDSSRVPSYRLVAGMPSYEVFSEELRRLLGESAVLGKSCGKGDAE